MSRPSRHRPPREPELHATSPRPAERPRALPGGHGLHPRVVRPRSGLPRLRRDRRVRVPGGRAAARPLPGRRAGRVDAARDRLRGGADHDRGQPADAAELRVRDLEDRPVDQLQRHRAERCAGRIDDLGALRLAAGGRWRARGPDRLRERAAGRATRGRVRPRRPVAQRRRPDERAARRHARLHGGRDRADGRAAGHGEARHPRSVHVRRRPGGRAPGHRAAVDRVDRAPLFDAGLRRRAPAGPLRARRMR